MSPDRFLGVVLLAVVATLLFIGLGASYGAAEQTSKSFFGRFTHDMTWLIVGGAGLGMLAILPLIFEPRAKRA